MSVLGYNETDRETTELSEVEAIKVAAFGLDRPEEAWDGEASFTAEIEATFEPWLIWRRALNVALYPFRNKQISMIQKHDAENAAARAVYEAGAREAKAELVLVVAEVTRQAKVIADAVQVDADSRAAGMWPAPTTERIVAILLEGSTEPEGGF